MKCASACGGRRAVRPNKPLRENVLQAGDFEETGGDGVEFVSVHSANSPDGGGRKLAKTPGKETEYEIARTLLLACNETLLKALLEAFFDAFPMDGTKDGMAVDVDEDGHFLNLSFHYYS